MQRPSWLKAAVVLLAAHILVRAGYERASGRDPWAAYGPMAAGVLLFIAIGIIAVVWWIVRRLRDGQGIARLRRWLAETPD